MLALAVVVSLPTGISLGHDVYMRDGKWIHHHTRTYETYNAIDDTGLKNQANGAVDRWDTDTNLALPRQSTHSGSDIQLVDGRYGDTEWRATSYDEDDPGQSDQSTYHATHTHIRFNLDKIGSSFNGYRKQALACREVGHVLGIAYLPEQKFWDAEGANNDCMSFSSINQTGKDQNPNSYTFTSAPGPHSIRVINDTYDWHDRTGNQSQLHGLQLHPMREDVDRADWLQELAKAKEAGADTIRFDLGWGALEHNGDGQLRQDYVAKADDFINTARAAPYGLKVIMTLWTTPCWASAAPDSVRRDASGTLCPSNWHDLEDASGENRHIDRYPPRDAAEYAETAAWAADRWGSQLTALEVWNEPNLDEFLITPVDSADARADAYAPILKSAYQPIKSEAPGLTVLGGAFASGDAEFISKLYNRGIKGSYDAISYHPYNEWRAPGAPPEAEEFSKSALIAGTENVREEMAESNDSFTKLWITEFGFSSCKEGRSLSTQRGDGGIGDVDDHSDKRACVDEALQADYTDDNHRIVRRWPFVQAAITYQLRNYDTSNDRNDNFGLLEEDFSAKPAWTNFKQAMSDYAETP